ncbi:MAG: DUF3842 family protein [Thermodesulfovibrionales bacterium]
MIVKRLKEECKDSIEIIALGTNAAATSAMMKTRANKGATGENAIIWNSSRVDLLAGTLSIVLPDAMLGELTPATASAVVSASALKILLPLNQEGVSLVGLSQEPLPHMIEQLVLKIRERAHVRD